MIKEAAVDLILMILCNNEFLISEENPEYEAELLRKLHDQP